MYRCAIFDLGGVCTACLQTSKIRDLLAANKLDFAEIEQHRADRLELDRNKISREDFYVRCYPQISGELAKNLAEAEVNTYLTRNEATLKTMQSLKSKGLLLALSTSLDKSAIPTFRRIYSDYMDLCDGVFISSELGIKKPSNQMLKAMFNALQVKPQETIYIDDDPLGLRLAKLAGCTCIKFIDNRQLDAELKVL